MRFYVPNYHIYRNDRLDGNRGGTAVAVKKKIPHTCVDLPPLLSLEATGVSIPTGHTEMLLTSVYKSPLRAWRDADITEFLNLRQKSILAGDLNAKDPVWNSEVSNPSCLKILDLFVNFNFEILAPQHPTHSVPNGRGDVLDTVVHRDVRLSEVRVLDIMDSDHLPIMFCRLDHIKPR
jgi:endonuclease/exonuclease/phosphatase (EEP) superfamily protein YafD